MRGRACAPILLLILLMPLHLIIECYAWGNGGYSSSPSAPKYGTHDWIAEHALDWLPSEARQWIIANLNPYIYGTELPDNGQAPDGIGDTNLHHIYFSAGGALVDDAAARRANATFNQALSLMLSGNFASAVKYAGSHVIEVESPCQPSPGVSYTFIGWSDYSTSNPRTVTVSSDTTVAAYMQPMPSGASSGGGQQTATVTFRASGLTSPSPARSILVVVNQFYGADQLPITFTWDVGSTHAYAWAEIVGSIFEDTRFRLAFVTGLSNKSLDFITVPPEGGFIEAVYKAQYRVGIGAEAGRGTTDPPPGIYWFDAGTYLNVTAIPGTARRQLQREVRGLPDKAGVKEQGSAKIPRAAVLGEE